MGGSPEATEFGPDDHRVKEEAAADDVGDAVVGDAPHKDWPLGEGSGNCLQSLQIPPWTQWESGEERDVG